MIIICDACMTSTITNFHGARRVRPHFRFVIATTFPLSYSVFITLNTPTPLLNFNIINVATKTTISQCLKNTKDKIQSVQPAQPSHPLPSIQPTTNPPIQTTEIAKQAERDLNTNISGAQANTEATGAKGASDSARESGVDASVENKFPGSEVKYGSEASGAGGNRDMPEGGTNPKTGQ